MCGIFAHLGQWLCDSYLKCASYISSLTCMDYVYIDMWVEAWFETELKLWPILDGNMTLKWIINIVPIHDNVF